VSTQVSSAFAGNLLANAQSTFINFGSASQSVLCGLDADGTPISVGSVAIVPAGGEATVPAVGGMSTSGGTHVISLRCQASGNIDVVGDDLNALVAASGS
jgi:hypothetical protein